MKYTARLVWAAIIVNVFLGLIVYSVLDSKRAEYEANAFVNTQNLSDLMAGELGARLGSADNVLENVADEHWRQLRQGRADAAEMDGLIQRQLLRHPELKDLRVVDARREAAVSAGDGVFTLKRQSDPVSAEPGILLARIFHSADGLSSITVQARMGLRDIENDFVRLKLGNKGSVAVRDASLGLIARYPALEGKPPGNRAISNDFETALARQPDSGSYVSGLTSIDGIARFHTYKRHPKYPIYVNVGAARDEVLQAWHKEVRAAVIIRGTFAVLSGLAVWMLAVIRRRKEQALAQAEESEARFRAIIDASPLPYALFDNQGAVSYLNPAFITTFGYARDDLRTLDDWWPKAYPDEACREQVVNTWRRRMAEPATTGQGLQSYEVTVRCKNGQQRDVLMMTAPLGKALEGLHVVILYDITDRKKSEEKVQLATSIFMNASEGIMMTDDQGHIIEVNGAFTRITGYPREEVVGKTPRLLRSGRHAAGFYETMWQTITTNGYWSGEIWNRRKNGEVYPESITITAVRDAAGQTQNYVALFTDITTLKLHQQQLEHVAHHDALTSLPNRVLLADRLRQAMLQSQRRDLPLAVVYLDLDGFKGINDQYGHDVGDDLLVALSQRMALVLRDGDTLARVGGDEFVAVLVDLKDAHDFTPIIERLLGACAESMVVRDISMHVSASIGIALYPQDGTDAEQLLRHADQAMYLAKGAGKNRYQLYDVQQESALQAQRERLAHIRQALDRQEFVLYYQPKANMKTGSVTSVEALIRWQHPERGLLPPSQFLPFAEDHPIGVELGEWVIDQALVQVREWRRLNLDLSVSVNIGARQLQQADFTQRLAGILARHPDVKPDSLELDVREASVLKDLSRLSDVLNGCRDLGVRVALDNFGTGYFSFTHLKYLPAGALKIDQSFVRDMLDDGDDLAIVKSVIDLAAAFHREVVAEGVETVPHGERLLALGCTLAQGFGICHPMPAKDLPAWLAAWRPDAAWQAGPTPP